MLIKDRQFLSTQQSACLFINDFVSQNCPRWLVGMVKVILLTKVDNAGKARSETVFKCRVRALPETRGPTLRNFPHFLAALSTTFCRMLPSPSSPGYKLQEINQNQNLDSLICVFGGRKTWKWAQSLELIKNGENILDSSLLLFPLPHNVRCINVCWNSGGWVFWGARAVIKDNYSFWGAQFGPWGQKRSGY